MLFSLSLDRKVRLLARRKGENGGICIQLCERKEVGALRLVGSAGREEVGRGGQGDDDREDKKD